LRKKTLVKKILVTGPDGLLGSHIVRVLLEKGYEVRTLVFPGSRSQTLDGLPIERASGDILDTESLKKAVTGCDAVIHAAASTQVWPTRSARSWQVNCTGTENVVQLVLELGIRLVYVSTASSFGAGDMSAPGTETTPYDGSRFGLDYIESKYAAQNYVLNAVRESALKAVVINPTFMFGEYDSLPSSGQVILAVYRGKVPGFTSGGKNIVYAGDVAHACVSALSKGRNGECYIAGNKNMSYRELTTSIAKVVGRKPPFLYIPDFLILGFGYLVTGLALLFRFKPGFSHATALASCSKQFYSSEKAVRELGMPQTPVEMAIQAEFNWLKANNYC
jgi:dihydroflavonol-4-reductase